MGGVQRAQFLKGSHPSTDVSASSDPGKTTQVLVLLEVFDGEVQSFTNPFRTRNVLTVCQLFVYVYTFDAHSK